MTSSLPMPATHHFTELPNWFALREVADGIYHIWEPDYRDDYRCNIYVIQGKGGDLVLHTPGHSWGSVCLWDEAMGFLFCADTVYQGEIFDHLPCSDIPTYRQSMRRLRDYPARAAFPGHGPTLSGDDFRRVIDTYLSSVPGEND